MNGPIPSLSEVLFALRGARFTIEQNGVKLDFILRDLYDTSTMESSLIKLTGSIQATGAPSWTNKP